MSRTRPHSKSNRLLLVKETSMSSLRIKTLINFDSTRTLPRPITAGSFWATSRTFPQNSQVEVEGLSSGEVRNIYKAKCEDLDILQIKDQEQRFFNFCSKSFVNRTIGLNENGLALESMKVLSGILKKNFNFCRLNLSKNNIAEAGAVHLSSVLKKTRSIVSVDISSNDISSEGLSKFFYTLKSNQSLISINVCSLEGLHRNRLGCKGAEAVSEFLRVNRVLTHLNIGDTGIGKEGLEYLIQGLAHNQVLVFLDISNNGITHQGFEYFCATLLTTQLKELNLSGNKIGHKGCEHLAKALSSKLDKQCPLVKLELANCEINSYGVTKLCESLENNAHVTHLVLDSNNLTKYSGTPLGKFLSLNTMLQFISINACELKDENLGKICDGLCKNIGLRKINLSKNGITDAAAGFIAEVIKRNSNLVSIDLSYNQVKNKGGIDIVNALRFNNTIEYINFAENSLKDEAGRILSEITRFKHNLLKIDLTMNPMNLKYVKEIKDNLVKNNFNYKQLLSPRLKQKIEALSLKENNLEEIFEQIEEKKKEKIEYFEKVDKLQHKLSITKCEEVEKNNVINDEFSEIKEISQGLSIDIENVHVDNYKNKMNFEKLKEEISYNTAMVAQDIQKLEKKSKD